MTAGSPYTDKTSSRAAEEKDIDLKDIFAQLLARTSLIAFIAVIAAIGGVFVGQLPPSVFEARSVVQIERRSDRIVLPEELIGNLLAGHSTGTSGLATEAHIIRSRLVLGPVIDELEQRTVIRPLVAPVVGDIIYRRDIPYIPSFLPTQYAQYGEFIEASINDLPESQTGKVLQLRVSGPSSYQLETPDGSSISGEVNQPLYLPDGGYLVVMKIVAPSGRVYTIKRESLRETVARLAGGLTVRERATTGVVDFSFTGQSGGDAVETLNAIIKEYINQNLLRSAEQIDRSLSFIEAQLEKAGQERRIANLELASFRQDKQVNELSTSTQELLNAAIETEARLDELIFRKEQLLLLLTVNHPDVRQLEVEETRLSERLAELLDRLTFIPEVEQKLAGLVKRVERSQMLEQQLTSRAEQLRILRASTISNIRILEPAEVARWAGPDRRRPILIATAIGLSFSVILILSLNFFRRGIDDAGEIEALGVPLFATIGKSNVLNNKNASSKEYGLALFKPDDVAVEALRGLRTGLKFALASARSKTLMITSCAPGDGKSFVALNLALLYGQMGSRVLLIDADMRRGFLRRYFGVDYKHVGLSEYLSGGKEDCIRHFANEKIDVVLSGQFPPNPADLLESSLFAELLENANKNYDLVIIDVPPVLSVSEPIIIGQKVGMSMLVVQHLVTTAAEIEAAQKSLTTAGIKLSGAILNQYDASKSRYGRYGNKYNYSYGGYRYRYKSKQS
ncbi:MAG: polysaccharide biosynthesis tyrosine autokinase [Rhodobacterales bacterium]